MDAARSEPHLRDFETAAFAEQHVFLRHPHIVEAQMHVAARRMVVTEHMHRPDDLDAGRILGHQDLRLLLAGRCIRIGLDHHDHDRCRDGQGIFRLIPVPTGPGAPSRTF